MLVRRTNTPSKRASAGAGQGSDVMQAMAQTKPASSRGDGGDHDLLQLVSHHHPPITLAQPGLRFPGNLAHRIRYCLHSIQFVAGDAGWKAVTVRRLDQQGSGVDVASLGDGTNAATLAGGVF